MQNKQWYLSKTIWFSLLTGLASALVPVVPQAPEFVAKYLPYIGGAWAVIGVLLRAITKDKIKLLD